MQPIDSEGEKSRPYVTMRARVGSDLKDTVLELIKCRPEYSESDVLRYALEAVCKHFREYGDISFPVEVRPARVQIEKLRADLERQAKYLESIEKGGSSK